MGQRGRAVTISEAVEFTVIDITASMECTQVRGGLEVSLV